MRLSLPVLSPLELTETVTSQCLPLISLSLTFPLCPVTGKRPLSPSYWAVLCLQLFVVLFGHVVPAKRLTLTLPRRLFLSDHSMEHHPLLSLVPPTPVIDCFLF